MPECKMEMSENGILVENPSMCVEHEFVQAHASSFGNEFDNTPHSFIHTVLVDKDRGKVLKVYWENTDKL